MSTIISKTDVTRAASDNDRRKIDKCLRTINRNLIDAKSHNYRYALCVGWCELNEACKKQVGEQLIQMGYIYYDGSDGFAKLPTEHQEKIIAQNRLMSLSFRTNMYTGLIIQVV